MNMPSPGPKERPVRAAADETTPVPGMDRRRSTREPVVTVGMIRPLIHDDAPAEQVLVIDVSLHGVGLRSTTTLAVGARYHIEIGVGPLHLISRFRVIRCRIRHDGTYDIGGEFC